MYYDDLKHVFGERMLLIYMDTDRFILLIETKDLDKELIESGINKTIDVSGYSPDHILCKTHPYPNKKKILEMFKMRLSKTESIATLKEHALSAQRCTCTK